MNAMTPRREPTLTRLETCWLLKGPSGRVFECGIFRTDAPGLEVRAAYGEADLVRSQLASEIGAAREIAEEWKQAVLGKGSFTPVDNVDDARRSSAARTA